jgi:hypothetical protein
MRRLIVSSLITAGMLLMAGLFTPAYSQSHATSDTPTFYRLVPGTYVNGWPRFIVHYPKDWVERPLNALRGDVFGVSPPGSNPTSTFFGISIGPWPLPVEKFTDFWVSNLKRMGMTEIAVVIDKPTRLRDGTPAREVELTMLANGQHRDVASLTIAISDVLILATAWSPEERVSAELRASLYSLELQPERGDSPKVPSDVQEFLNRFCADVVSHDVDRIASHFSDRFLASGERRAPAGQNWKQIAGAITSCRAVVTDFVPAEEKAHLAGFLVFNTGKCVLMGTSIIREDGEWKWYGNQRDVKR